MFRALQSQYSSQNLQGVLSRMSGRADVSHLLPAAAVPAEYTPALPSCSVRRRRIRREPLHAGTGIRSTWF